MPALFFKEENMTTTNRKEKLYMIIDKLTNTIIISDIPMRCVMSFLVAADFYGNNQVDLEIVEIKVNKNKE